MNFDRSELVFWKLKLTSPIETPEQTEKVTCFDFLVEYTDQDSSFPFVTLINLTVVLVLSGIPELLILG